jgi:D-arabinose 1-dehydrogenase-like Zn-dependent alcohol dehydrogenase
MIGSPKLIEEMLHFAALHKIGAQIQKLPMAKAEEGVQRVRAGKARYRIVLENPRLPQARAAKRK